MCGRFAYTLSHDAMAQLFRAAPSNSLPSVPVFNVCPTTEVAVVRAGEPDQRRLVAMRWGFVPHWYDAPGDGPLLINARAETIAEKPAFKAACRTRRCLIPARGFYEWHREGGEKLPYFIERRDGAPLVMAGIWQDWQQGEVHLTSCAIVTTGANAVMAPIHHRMPVVLEAADWGMWLGEAGVGAARLMVPAGPGVLSAFRVAQDVNSNRAEGPELIVPLEQD